MLLIRKYCMWSLMYRLHNYISISSSLQSFLYHAKSVRCDPLSNSYCLVSSSVIHSILFHLSYMRECSLTWGLMYRAWCCGWMVPTNSLECKDFSRIFISCENSSWREILHFFLLCCDTDRFDRFLVSPDVLIGWDIVEFDSIFKSVCSMFCNL